MNYTHIFWDWNGTLLDDVDYCIETVNRSLSARSMPTMDKAKYYKLFRFPVIEYYKALGFSFETESYDALAEEFNRNYAIFNSSLRLRKHVREVLAVFKGKKIPQYILSASERTVLVNALKAFDIEKYFDAVLCTDSYLAEGKISYGKKFVETLPKNTHALLIGDTQHDLETALAIGADCVLLKNGHTSDEKLSSLDVKVVNSLHELYPIVFGEQKTCEHKKITLNADALEKCSFDINEAEPKTFRTAYKDFYDDLKNTLKTEDW